MNDRERLRQKYKSPMVYVLSGLIPYTEANLKLAFKPAAFFSDLRKLDQAKFTQQSLNSAYYRAIKKNFITLDKAGVPRLTKKGAKKIRAFQAPTLDHAELMVIFDIPESERSKRDHLRLLLKEFSFEQVQKSVWATNKDCRDYLHSEIREYGLEDYVQLFEARRLAPRI